MTSHRDVSPDPKSGTLHSAPCCLSSTFLQRVVLSIGARGPFARLKGMREICCCTSVSEDISANRRVR